MPTYHFRCEGCGSFEAGYAMAEVPATAPCPTCAGASRRGFGGGALLHTGSAASRLLEATARTASEPRVVNAPPPGRGTPVTRNPLHRKLPRP
ncbi:FmdB family zinc ribbon protein [Nocardia panacis]|uniref:FmdB family zinc ribbon protein n=1 Tax=Nocardia panacis TaxID=2340916 RepID=UPI00193A5C48|nr:zinc ribbon domain-containing protein [Nocardia panacis]